MIKSSTLQEKVSGIEKTLARPKQSHAKMVFSPLGVGSSPPQRTHSPQHYCHQGNDSYSELELGLTGHSPPPALQTADPFFSQIPPRFPALSFLYNTCVEEIKNTYSFIHNAMPQIFMEQIFIYRCLYIKTFLWSKRKWTGFEIDLGSRQCGLETLSLLQTMGELGTWVCFSPPTPPNHSASIHAAWKQGRNQEHSVLSAILHDGWGKSNQEPGIGLGPEPGICFFLSLPSTCWHSQCEPWMAHPCSKQKQNQKSL